MDVSRTITLSIALAMGALTACGEGSILGLGGSGPGGPNGGAGAGQGPGGGQGTGGSGEDCGPVGSNGDIYQRLGASCASCHGKGTSRPFFASSQSFDDLLAYEPTLVTPGKPEESRLVALLRGTAQGSYSQMPLGDLSFEALASQGKTSITMAEVTAWITSLKPRTSTTTAALSGPTVRRLSPAELVVALDQAIGLTPADLFQPNNMPARAEALLIQSPNVLNTGPTYAYNGASDRYERWQSIGGGDHFAYRRSQSEVSPAFVQTITQVGQARCRLAASKSDNQAFFAVVGPDETSATAPDKIRQGIGQLGRRILSERMTDGEVELLYTQVFLPHERPEVPRNGWVAVCAALLRDPRFLFY